MPTVSTSETTAEPVSSEFDEIFREYHTLIYRTANGVTGSVQDAEDIVQTVLFSFSSLSLRDGNLISHGPVIDITGLCREDLHDSRRSTELINRSTSSISL
jgi:hypothetical protein